MGRVAGRHAPLPTPGHARSATSIRHNGLVLPVKFKRDKRIWATLACLPDADRDRSICGTREECARDRALLRQGNMPSDLLLISTGGRLRIRYSPPTARGSFHASQYVMGRCGPLFNGRRSAPRNWTRFAAQYLARGVPCPAVGVATLPGATKGGWFIGTGDEYALSFLPGFSGKPSIAIRCSTGQT
jgi:hypothetical protein